MTNSLQHKNWFIAPITEMEATILGQADLIQGLNWGRPSYGHPESAVAFHVLDVLKNIDKLELSLENKYRLRLAAITHDSFKYKECKIEKGYRHGKLARNFLAQFTDDLLLLELLEWHDEAYHAWQLAFKHNNIILANRKIKQLLHIFGADITLFQQFFICDSATGDKIKHPVEWFAKVLAQELEI